MTNLLRRETIASLFLSVIWLLPATTLPAELRLRESLLQAQLAGPDDKEPLAQIAQIALVKGTRMRLSKGFCGLLEFNAGGEDCFFKHFYHVAPNGELRVLAVVEDSKPSSIDILVAHRTEDEGYFYRTSISAALTKAVHSKKGVGARIVAYSDAVARFREEVRFWHSKERELAADKTVR